MNMVQSSKPLVELSDVTLRIRDRVIFRNTSWRIRENEHWAVLGPNGSGKSLFVRAILGETPLRAGSIFFGFGGKAIEAHPYLMSDFIGYLSFESHQHLMKREGFQEEIRIYAGKKEEMTTAEQVILERWPQEKDGWVQDRQRILQSIDLLGISHLLHRNVLSLSTGEMRKVLIARALVKSPKLLILDEPFDGLDPDSRVRFAEWMNSLIDTTRVILVTHRMEEVLPNITHVLLVKNCGVYMQGRKESVLNSRNMSALYDCSVKVAKDHGSYSAMYESVRKTKAVRVESSSCRPSVDMSLVPDPLIEMRNVVVRYGDKMVLDGISWTMKRGESWAILGPNGAGKSTLLKLIYGEHLQAYRNDIFLFGKKRGSGESIWEIRKRIGIFSPDLLFRHRKDMKSYDVVASGLYDSIGLYRFPTPEQMHVVSNWFDMLEIGDLRDLNFHNLSHGQKRLVLLARAMVKLPVLMILDEPCDGLDMPSRRKAQNLIEIIGNTQTHLLYVTHRPEQIPRSITHVLRLEQGKIISQGKRNLDSLKSGTERQ